MALTQAQKDWRRKGIGGSDAITIARGTGQQWSDLRDEKIGGKEPAFNLDQRFRMDLGSACEPVILDHLASTGIYVGERGAQKVMPADPFFRCTLDAITSTSFPVQVKMHFGMKSLEELTEFYWPQLQHELIVTGASQLLFAAAFGHWAKFDHQWVPGDPAFQNGYMARALQFKAFCWENAPLPDDLKVDTPMAALPTSIPRLRDHVWPEGDNTIGPLALEWLRDEEAAINFAEVAKKLKDNVPSDARSALWAGNGVGIKITVNKAGAKSIKPYVAGRR